jgi:hopanoid-associated sugar epimerase
VLQTLGFDRRYVRGEGCYLYDDAGQRYLDFLSGFGVHALGRSHPAVKAALHQVIDLDLPNLVQLDCAPLAGLLAEQLVTRSHPGIERAYFCNSGAEAVESAIKFARCATRRAKVVYADHAFHGLTTGVLALNGGKEFRAGFGPLLPDCHPVPFGDLGALRCALRGNDVAAFIVEPIQGKGVYCADSEYWPAAAELCRRSGTLLVMDEVQTGLGRTGRFFCHEHWGLRPDIITVSKALSGGYVPVGAVLTTGRVFASVYPGRQDAMKHGTTFGQNQLAMAAGLATLAALDDEGIVANAERTGRALRDGLRGLAERYEVLRDVRGLGLMIGLEFAEPRSGPLRHQFRALEWLRPAMFAQMVVVPLFHRHRVLTQVAADGVNVIKLLPPLIAGPAEVEYFLAALDDVLADAHRGPGLACEFGLTMARGLAGARSPAAPPRRDATQPAAPPRQDRQATAAAGPAGTGGTGVRHHKAARTAPSDATRIEPGDRVLITGGAGFIGSAVARAARARGAQVVALLEPGADAANLAGIEAERIVADIRDPAAVRAACTGARFVFHLAAVYRFWARDPAIFGEVNVGGTVNVLDAVAAAGCERLVYTSTVGVLGLPSPVRNGTGPADEDTHADIGHLFGHYKQTKYVAEHEVLRAAAQGLDVSLVLPTFPLGPGDRGPTPTGKLVVDFLNGQLPAFVDTAMNVVHVDDLAAGHLAVLERGSRGRSYVLGGENLSMREILDVLAECTGLPRPRLEIPRAAALTAGVVSELIEGRVLGREPRVPLEAARMSATKMVFSDERARREVGYSSRPARAAIEDSARWFIDNGYVSAGRKAAIRWRPFSGDGSPAGGPDGRPDGRTDGRGDGRTDGLPRTPSDGVSW